VPGGKVSEGRTRDGRGVADLSFDIKPKLQKPPKSTSTPSRAKCGVTSKPGDQAKEKEADKKESAQDKLKAKAKISESKAREIALDKVPMAKSRKGELEEEKGKLIWSFDICHRGLQEHY